MTADDTRAFRASLRRLELAYGCPVDSARDPVYFAALEEFPITTVVSAADDLAFHHRTMTGRFPITHDLRDRCREFVRAAEIRHPPTRAPRPEPNDDTPPMSKADFFARLDTLRRKLARCRPAARHHSSLTPLAEIADSLTHPHAIPGPDDPSAIPDADEAEAMARDADPPREREPGDDDGAEDDPDAV